MSLIASIFTRVQRGMRFWLDEILTLISLRSARHVVLAWPFAAVSFWIVALLTPGFALSSWHAAILAVPLLALLNASLRPVIVYLTLPFAILTLGLLTLALDAGLLLLVAAQLPGVTVDGLGAAVLGGLGLGVMNALVSGVLQVNDDESFYRNLMSRISRRRGVAEQRTDTPGMVILQLDGLGAVALQQAIDGGYLPTLGRWLRQGSHRVTPWECGLPSETSGSQAGILYGSNFDIPAFRWFDKDTDRLVVTSRPVDAAAMVEGIAGQGLLSPSGSAVSTLFSGGAARSVLAVSALASPGGARSDDFFFYLINPYSFSRLLVMMVLEVALELWQSLTARVRNVQPRVSRGRSFPLLRAASCVLLRDLTTSLLIEEMYAGVPVVFAGFPGYDEVAHYAGPRHADALRALRDIDRQLAALERAAAEAPRWYYFVVLSDHGQAAEAPFRQRYGVSLDAVVRPLLPPDCSLQSTADGGEGWGTLNAFLTEVVTTTAGPAGWLLRRLLQKRTHDGYIELGPDRPRRAPGPPDIVLTASGNVAQLYCRREAGRVTLEAITETYPGLVPGLLQHEGIGFVLAHSREHGAVALGRGGRHYLQEGRIEGADPLAALGPYSPCHLRELGRFPHAGDLVIHSRVDPDTGEVAAFEEFIGCHGGLGGEQTRPFLLFPAQWEMDDEGPPVGAPAIHAVLRRWLDQLQTGPPSSDVAPAAVREDLDRSRAAEH